MSMCRIKWLVPLVLVVAMSWGGTACFGQVQLRVSKEYGKKILVGVSEFRSDGGGLAGMARRAGQPGRGSQE